MATVKKLPNYLLAKTLYKKNKVVLTQLQLDSLVGEYKLTENLSITITHNNDQIVIQAIGQQQIPFVTKSESEFINELVQAKVVFEFDNDGKANSMTLFQGGQKLKGIRVE
jgi:glutaredoxin 2